MTRRHLHECLALACFILICFLAARPDVNLYDEGLVAFGAQRVRDGAVPYRDFWTMYGPGAFYTGAALYDLFGIDLLPIRIVGWVAKAASALAIGALSARAASPALKWPAAGVALAMLIAVDQPAFPVFPALALILWAFVLIGRPEKSTLQLAMAGVLIGAAAAYRHDLGAYACIAAAAALLAEIRIAGGERQFRRGAARTGWVAAGVLLVVIPISAMLAASVPWDKLWFNLIYVPAVIYPATRALPLGGVSFPLSEMGVDQLENITTLAPFLIGFPALVLLVRELKQPPARPGEGQLAVLPVLLVSATLLFALKGMVRSTNLHMIQSLILAIPTALWAWRASRAPVRAARVCRPPLVLGMLLAAGVVAVGLVNAGSRIVRIASDPAALIARCRPAETLHITCASISDDTRRVAEFVTARTGPGEAIYVGPGRHDRIWANPIALYLITGRRSVTPWHDSHPGVQTRDDIQHAIAGELAPVCGRTVVLDDSWSNSRELTLQHIPEGSHYLDRFLAAHFREDRRYGPYRILTGICTPRQLPGFRA